MTRFHKLLMHSGFSVVEMESNLGNIPARHLSTRVSLNEKLAEKGMEKLPLWDRLSVVKAVAIADPLRVIKEVHSITKRDLENAGLSESVPVHLSQVASSEDKDKGAQRKSTRARKSEQGKALKAKKAEHGLKKWNRKKRMGAGLSLLKEMGEKAAGKENDDEENEEENDDDDDEDDEEDEGEEEGEEIEGGEGKEGKEGETDAKTDKTKREASESKSENDDAEDEDEDEEEAEEEDGVKQDL